MPKNTEEMCLSIIKNWMDDNETSVSNYISDSGEHIFAYYYHDDESMDDSINFVTGKSWQEVLEKGFIDPIRDYLSDSSEEQSYFTKEEMNFLAPYVKSNESAVTQFNDLLKKAQKMNASDIRFEQTMGIVKASLNINGKYVPISQQYDENILKELRYLSNVSLGQTNEPVTGRFELELDNDLKELRYSEISSIEGSTSVLRFINPLHQKLCNQNQNYYEKLQKAFNNNHGLIIIGGSEKQGKTTTAYSMLNSIKNKKIFTIEDPIEVYNDNFVQLQVNKDANFSFPEAIKQALRHEPDILMLSEIKDAETAKMALTASNLGTLVVTTMHGRDNYEILDKLIKMADENLIKDNLICVACQTLEKTNNDETLLKGFVADKKYINDFFENIKENDSSKSL